MLSGSGPAEIRTCDLLGRERTFCRYATQATWGSWEFLFRSGGLLELTELAEMDIDERIRIVGHCGTENVQLTLDSRDKNGADLRAEIK